MSKKILIDAFYPEETKFVLLDDIFLNTINTDIPLLNVVAGTLITTPLLLKYNELLFDIPDVLYVIAVLIVDTPYVVVFILFTHDVILLLLIGWFKYVPSISPASYCIIKLLTFVGI